MNLKMFLIQTSSLDRQSFRTRPELLNIEISGSIAASIHRLSPWCMECIKVLCPKCSEQGRKRAWWINAMRLGKMTILIFILIPFPSSQVARASRPPVSRSWWGSLSNMVPPHQSKSIVPVYRILIELTQGSDSSGWRTEQFSTILYL